MKRGARPSGRTSGLQFLRVIWGAFLLVKPGRALALLGAADSGRGSRGVLRILGARHLLEAAAERHWGSTARKFGVGVDAAHAGTALGFAMLDRRWRRVALADAAVAAIFASAEGLGALEREAGP